MDDETVFGLFQCTEAMRRILKQCMRYWEMSGMDYHAQITRMRERGELPCHNKREGMERIEQLKRNMFI
ncbi:MAG: hypothetical protein J5819_02745 [Eubacterium sp.]|nr:hypothetical protein [Eubacterium sp.]